MFLVLKDHNQQAIICSRSLNTFPLFHCVWFPLSIFSSRITYVALTEKTKLSIIKIHNEGASYLKQQCDSFVYF